MPGAGQPLFPIGGAPAANGATLPQPGVLPQPVASGPPGGSLFPINLQDPAARPVLAGQPGMLPTSAMHAEGLKHVIQAIVDSFHKPELINW